MDGVPGCPHRRDISYAGAEESATCALLAAAFHSSEPRLVRVQRDVCNACCRASDPADARTNPVIASLLYGRAMQHLLEFPASAHADQFIRLHAEGRRCLARSPDLVSRQTGALGVLTAGERRLQVAGRPRVRLTWAVAMLTAPRQRPVLASSLESLRAAGFENIQIFAESGSPIPQEWADAARIVHEQRLGHLRNFAFAAKTLLDQQPAADCYAIFEDDISAARGLRDWCDGQLWPARHGIVSLYTCRVFADDRPGWQTLNLGRYRTFGALAFVFRGEALRAFLSDAGVMRHVAHGTPGADAVVGEWALRTGIGIAYHTPSLVQHECGTPALAGHEVGRAGRALAVESVGDAGRWQPPPARPGRVGLIGWNTPTGLGYQNRDIAKHLPVDRWLAPRHPQTSRLRPPRMPGAYWAPWSRTPSKRSLRNWLSGLDWLIFVEQPYLDGIVQLAREMWISVACVPNWEWLSLDLDWLPFIDLMICPTAVAERMVRRWRRDMGFAWDVAYVPWPVDPCRFPFRRRERCRRFLFVNGTAGTMGWRPDGRSTPYRRKGLELIAATAGLLPHVPFLVYSQVPPRLTLPKNVEVRRAPRLNSELYRDGDVCVQPSHWEGLGLQLLECQAAGMPLVTTAAPPMTECRPFRTVPVLETEVVFVRGDQPVESQLICPEDLAAVLEGIYDTDIGEASKQARAYIEQERSWPRVRETIAALMPA
jgi:glycosyltransferase involved in cell wall biosynthesis